MQKPPKLHVHFDGSIVANKQTGWNLAINDRRGHMLYYAPTGRWRLFDLFDGLFLWSDGARERLDIHRDGKSMYPCAGWSFNLDKRHVQWCDDDGQFTLFDNIEVGLIAWATDDPQYKQEQPAPVNDAWKEHENDFNSMTDEEIEQEVRDEERNLEAAESWLEAVASWKAAGKPRKQEQ